MSELIKKIRTALMLRDTKIKNDLDTLEKLEQITDDFAVKFLNWFEENNRYYSLTTTELLQIFKEKYYD